MIVKDLRSRAIALGMVSGAVLLYFSSAVFLFPVFAVTSLVGLLARLVRRTHDGPGSSPWIGKREPGK